MAARSSLSTPILLRHTKPASVMRNSPAVSLVFSSPLSKLASRSKSSDRFVACVVRDKYGSDVDLEEDGEEDETDYSTEDSEGELVTPQIDAAILNTLAKIRKRDASIYEAGRQVFRDEGAFA